MSTTPASKKTPDTLADARERIRAIYDPELIRDAMKRAADVVAEHFASVQSSSENVLNWAEPEANVRAVTRMLDDAAAEHVDDTPADPKVVAAQAAELVRILLERGQNLHDPRYIGHQVPASVPLAGLLDGVGAITNQVMAIYEMGPWVTSVERALIHKLGEQLGWKVPNFSGLVTHGGSLANLTALLTARNVLLGDAWEKGVYQDGPLPVIVAHGEAHYSVSRSAGILGLGTNQVVRAKLDDQRRMDPAELDATLGELKSKGHPIIAVSASSCATPTGAFDPLPRIADVCEKHGVWLHVDAAHGGAAAFSRRHRHLVAGLERADSVVWDAHKMMFVPSLCAFTLYKDAKHRFEAFRQDAPYLFDPSAPGMAEYDSGMKTLECTKRTATLGLWCVWSLFGPRIFEDLVDVTFDLGREFYAKLSAASDFETLHEPECNIVVFRYIPPELRDGPRERLGAFQFELRKTLIHSGEYYIVPAKKDGIGAMRVTIINPLTTGEHLDGLMDALRRHGKKLLSSG